MAGQHRTTHASQSRHTVQGIWEEGIKGSFRSISVHQLCMAWWLHVNDYITRRQLRVYFAAHEMAERRRASSRMNKKQRTRPLYTIEEIAGLVGGRGTPRSIADLKADVRRLKALGLVAIEPHEIRFAGSMDDINVEDASGFWDMFDRVPSGKRSVPVPRRTLRALAAGFSRGVTGVMLATLIRSLFWHKSTGEYRVDGRTKGSWIAEVFSISRRAVTDARATLIELGWLEQCETPQWALNRWGAHDQINTEWRTNAMEKASTNDNQNIGETASLRSSIRVESASPDQTDSLPLKGNQETRRLRDTPSRSGVRMDSRSGREPKPILSDRSRPPRKSTPSKRPTIRDVQPADLASMDRLLELHDQAVALGLAASGEAGRLDFVALAERARCRGIRAGALFFWLLRERKTAFITQLDEDRAASRLKEHLYGVAQPRYGQPPNQDDHLGLAVGAPQEGLSDDQRFAVVCVRVAKQQRLDDPFRIAAAKGWTRERWEAALATIDGIQACAFVGQHEVLVPPWPESCPRLWPAHRSSCNVHHALA